MAVKQREIDSSGLSTRADRDVLETGVIDEEVVALSGIWFVRALAGLLIVLTTFGTLVPLAGGWAAFREGLTAAGAEWWTYFRTPRGASALGLGLIFQGLLMWGQWGTKTNLVLWWRRLRWAGSLKRADGVLYAAKRVAGWLLGYVLLLLLSAAPSTYTYAAWAQPLYRDLPDPWPLTVAGLIGILAVIGDMIPEVIFVRRAPPPPEPETEV